MICDVEFSDKMPTVILLDSSLSMSRLATPNPNPNSPIELSSSGLRY